MFKYKELINRIEEDIFPQLSPGSLLPGTPELCRKYAVSEITVKKALSLLAKERRVRRIPRKGTLFQPEQLPQIRHVSSRPPRTVLKLLALNRWDTADLLENLCREFTALYPDTEFEFHRSSASYFEEISPEGYDVILGNTWMIREYLTAPEYKNSFAPLHELPGIFINENIYFAEVLKWCRRNDQLYCLPLGISPVFAMFHMDYPVFRNMALPTCQTLADFQQLLYRLRYERPEESKYYPFLMEMLENRWPCFIKMAGGQLFDPVTGQCTFDHPQTITALEMIQQLFQNHIIPGLQLSGNISVSGLFTTGKFGCTWGTYKYLRSNIQKSINVHYQMLPQTETRCSHLLMEGLLVNRHCGNPEMVGKLLNFLQTSDVHLKICHHADTFSTQQQLAEFYFAHLAVKVPSVLNVLEQVKYAEPVATAPHSKDWRIFCETMPKIWMGIDSVANVCREITETINKTLKSS